MKNLITLSLAFTMMIIVYSCQPKTEPCPEISEKHPNGLYELSANHKLTYAEFDTMVTAWNNNYRSYMASDSLHYLDMPLADLTSIVGHSKSNSNDAARIYMGMKNDPAGILRPHIIIAGTRNGQVDTTMLMDYTTSCPNECPQN